MKKNINFNLFGLLLFVLFAFTSCEEAEQDVSPIISPDNKPMITISDFTGTALAGNTVIYTISFDKPIDRAVTFTPSIIGGTADESDFEALEPVTMQPYTTSVEFPVTLIQDYIVGPDKTLEIQLEILGVAEKYLVNPNAVIPPINLTFGMADPTLLIVNFAWNTEDDMDIVTWSDTNDYPSQLWGTGGATSANPEVDHAIWLSDPVGDYYVSIIDWDQEVTFNYTFTLGHPDGSTQTISGTWNPANAGNYVTDVGPGAWGNPALYRVLKVVNNGTSFVVTAL